LRKPAPPPRTVLQFIKVWMKKMGCSDKTMMRRVTVMGDDDCQWAEPKVEAAAPPVIQILFWTQRLDTSHNWQDNSALITRSTAAAPSPPPAAQLFGAFFRIIMFFGTYEQAIGTTGGMDATFKCNTRSYHRDEGKICLYLDILIVGNENSAGTAMRNTVRQQQLVLKVGTFVVIELVTFPLGSGFVLDLCTTEANMQSRIAFVTETPLMGWNNVRVGFSHLYSFQYSYTVLLSACRNFARPGNMWFIKDPEDQNSYPIRDILDQPTLVQLREICVPGIIYSFVMACLVGNVAGLLVQLAIKHVSTTVWKFLATRLRLTSYFFGGRYPQEEYTPKNWRDSFIRYVVGEGEVPDGSFRRMPATDNSLPRDMRATVAVAAEGEPVDDAARELIALQNAEVEKAKWTIKDDYTVVVYLSLYFRYRIICFITLWIFGTFFLGRCPAYSAWPQIP
ncbi:hypothetical protein H0H81_009125, partial [Sphagnurus paluster]